VVQTGLKKAGSEFGSMVTGLRGGISKPGRAWTLSGILSLKKRGGGGTGLLGTHQNKKSFAGCWNRGLEFVGGFMSYNRFRGGG